MKPTSLIPSEKSDLPNLLGKKFLSEWAQDQEQTFKNVMQTLAEEKPDKWAEIYLRINQFVAAPQPNGNGGSKNNTTNNIFIGDMEKMRALANTNIPKNNKPFAQYEEYQEVQSQ